jgi:hypothetical protein
VSRPWQMRIGGSLGLGLIAGLLVAGADSPRVPAVEPAATTYSPLVPAAAIQAALQANLKIVRDWLDQEDFASAATAAQRLGTLAQLHGYQSTQSRWHDQIASLQQACSKLAAAAKRKDANGCEKMAQECASLLNELAAHPPTGDKVMEKNFKPFGPTNTWMWLMEGAYVDARWATTAQEMEPWAYTLAEEMNVVAHLRANASWRTMALETRAAALQAASSARQNDLTAARQALKNVRSRCDACHHDYKR